MVSYPEDRPRVLAQPLCHLRKTAVLGGRMMRSKLKQRIKATKRQAKVVAFSRGRT